MRTWSILVPLVLAVAVVQFVDCPMPRNATLDAEVVESSDHVFEMDEYTFEGAEGATKNTPFPRTEDLPFSTVAVKSTSVFEVPPVDLPAALQEGAGSLRMSGALRRQKTEGLDEE